MHKYLYDMDNTNLDLELKNELHLKKTTFKKGFFNYFDDYAYI